MQDVKYYNGKLYIEVDEVWDNKENYLKITENLIYEIEDELYDEDEIDNFIDRNYEIDYLGEWIYQELKPRFNAKFWRPLQLKELL